MHRGKVMLGSDVPAHIFSRPSPMRFDIMTSCLSMPCANEFVMQIPLARE